MPILPPERLPLSESLCVSCPASPCASPDPTNQTEDPSLPI